LEQLILSENQQAFKNLKLIKNEKKLESFWKEYQRFKHENSKISFATRYPVIFKPIANLSVVNTVIYGPCGYGKTTTINNICGTNF
jgi:Cdc6-like AAA superfamily ATPase